MLEIERLGHHIICVHISILFLIHFKWGRGAFKPWTSPLKTPGNAFDLKVIGVHIYQY